MSKIVIKFGGSNMRRPEDIAKLARIAKGYGRPFVAVVSAFYGVTDEIEECVRKASEGGHDEGAFAARLLALKERVIEAAVAPARRAAVLAQVSERVARLERYLLGIHYLEDVPGFARDAALSYGERLSSAVLAAAFADAGLPCEEALPEDIGLVAEGEFGNAGCDLAASEPRVRDRLSGDRSYVVPGFYGVGADGRVRLFGRGGTDYSAACIARCLGAESLDVWKDVRGFLAADPGAVDAPGLIPHLSYAEAAELSYFGAKILHPRTVEPLLGRGIPIRIFDIEGPESGAAPGTVIDAGRSFASGAARAVSATSGIGILKLHGPGVGFKRGILAKAASALDGAGINIKSVITAQTSIDILLAEPELPKAEAALKEHRVDGVLEVSAKPGLAIVAVVGDGLLEERAGGRGVAARALAAVRAAGVHVYLTQAGASEVAVYIIVDAEAKVKAVRAAHAEFFGKKGGGCEE